MRTLHLPKGLRRKPTTEPTTVGEIADKWLKDHPIYFSEEDAEAMVNANRVKAGREARAKMPWLATGDLTPARAKARAAGQRELDMMVANAHEEGKSEGRKEGLVVSMNGHRGLPVGSRK